MKNGRLIRGMNRIGGAVCCALLVAFGGFFSTIALSKNKQSSEKQKAAAPQKTRPRGSQPPATKSSSDNRGAPTGAGNAGGGSYGGALESSGSTKATEVKGQIRNLSMMLVLKNQKDRIEFVRMRRDYRKEILETKY